MSDPVLNIMKKDKRRTTAIPTGRAADPAVDAGIEVVVVVVVLAGGGTVV
jgi:hypothetical protein